MTKQIFHSVLVTLSFFLVTSKTNAQTNLPPEICGRYAELNFTGTIPNGASGYWIDSTNTVINWWQDINNTIGNGAYTIAEVGQYGQNAFAFVIQDGANYDTSAWVSTSFIQKPQVDACPSCSLIENQYVDFGNGNIVHVNHLRTDTICLHDTNSTYLLDPAYNLGQGLWSLSSPFIIIGVDTIGSGIYFKNDTGGFAMNSNNPNDSIYVSVFNSDINLVSDFYILTFRSESGNGCADTDTMLVSFAKQPSGQIEYRQPYCHGQEALVWASLDNEANPTEFNWDFGSNANVLDAVADITTPDSIYSVNWGTDNDCNNLIHQVRLTASSDWGCVSSSNIVYIEEPHLVMPLLNTIQPNCGQANGEIKIQNDTMVACDDTINNTVLHKWIYSTITDFDNQTNYGYNATVDSLYNISSQDTSWLEISYISLITYDSNYVGPQVMCKDTVDIVLDDCTFVFNYNNKIDINVYPNPTIESITIEVNNNELIKNKEIITITDLTGKIVKISNLNSGNYTLNVSELKSGIYFIKIGNTTNKFIKE